MAAADAALYRAKACGRDQVQMISTTRGLSAVSSTPRAVNGAVAEEHGPSLFRRAASSLGGGLAVGVGTGRTARIAALPVWHCDAFPVLSTSGVLYPWQVQPLTTTGAPPPLPGTCPSLILAAYSFSTCIAVSQFTEPLATLMMTGTPAAVRVLPQVAPTPAVGGADEHAVTRQAQTQEHRDRAPCPRSDRAVPAAPLPARTVSP